MEDVLENTASHTNTADDITIKIEDVDDFIFSENIGKTVSER